MNSAHVVFQDSEKNIWVGTWGEGLLLLRDAYEPARTTWTTFKHDARREESLSDNLIYAISEDVNTHSLWVGTRSALSILPLQDEPGVDAAFSNHYAVGTEYSIASSEVASFLRDRQGIMWIGMIGGGVNMVDTRQADFVLDCLPEAKQMLKSNSLRSMMVDDENNLWLGISTYGFGVQNRASGKFIHFSQMPDWKSYRGISSVMCFMQSPSTGHVWIAVYDGGVYEVDKSAPVGRQVKHYYEEPWLCHPCVYSICEDSSSNLWVATRWGVSMRTSDGTPVRMDSLRAGTVLLRDMTFVQVTEGRKGEMWAASNTHGVVRIDGQGKNLAGYTATLYSVDNGKLNNNDVNCVFTDRTGRIWVGTGGSGLNLYDPQSDSFLPVHVQWNLPGDAVVSILEDRAGHLWLGTNAGLLKLAVSDRLEGVNFHLYTSVDGLQDNLFNRAAATMSADGEMFFGGHQGYNSFYPDKLEEKVFLSPVVVTDVKVFNRSWNTLPLEERQKVSRLSPGFADKLQFDYLHNNFSIEFSALEYANPERNRYAYRLSGFDDDWQYTDASKRFACYNNLSPGTYTFSVCASNSNGVWNDEVLKMKIMVLPPPWKTWWAYVLYFLTGLGLVYYAYCVVRGRIRLHNALRLREMEKEKAEEVNHAKLQFFTNITHELLTPLTILSASVDELKRTAPTHTEQYRVMTQNINRLIRLLQQILEFRKAETGNLKLRVSEGDLAQFVRYSLDSFRPLMKKKDMQFRLSCCPDPFVGYFDPDKLDKILYNLLSNASKYNRPGETVCVELSKTEEGTARLVVKDNGPGIAKEQQKNLFKRFYEGDYRKFKTIGTGIGLSLVRDLVVLHHGSITVESEEGKGTEFIITFPVIRQDYQDEEVEQVSASGVYLPSVEQKEVPVGEREADDNELDAVDSKSTHLLVVEDNEDLLQLMVKLLETDYRVYTASDGKKAIEVMTNKEVDLIVSDVKMPEMDGIELCRYVKGNFETSHIPIILLTAKNGEEDRVEAYESGADAFIGKPFSLSVLHARISNLLRGRHRTMKDFKKQLVFEARDLDYTSLDEEFLQRAIECVNRHLDDANFDQAQFLEEMHTTKSTCFRKLKSLKGLTYVSFIRNIRMKAACRIMEEKKHIRISELAYAVGYNDARYFSSSFKKEFGMQPTEYMERFTHGGGIVQE